MVIKKDGVEPAALVRPRESARVRQLQADEEVVGAAVAALMFLDQRFAQGGEIGERFLGQEQLVRLGPAVGAHGHGLAAPDQLGPARAEAPPAPQRPLAGPAVGFGVPALHRQDAEAVADGASADDERLGQRAVRLQVGVERRLDAKRPHSPEECFRGLQTRYGGERRHERPCPAYPVRA